MGRAGGSAASAGGPPGEEHVTVRGEPEPVVTVPPAAARSARESAAAFEDDDEEDETDWYDTASLEPVDQALGASAGSDDAIDDDEQPVAGPAEMEQPDDDQGDLFARPAASR